MTHTCPSHDPGTYACYRLDGCRCYPCGHARHLYDQHRERQIAYGRWEPFIDVAEVRDHLEWLRSEGVGLRTIAELTGMSRSTLSKITSGTTRRIRPDNAAKLLHIHPGRIADGATVPARPVWRLIQAMLAGGWTKAGLARALTGNPNTAALQLGRDRVTAGNARKVRTLHARWQAGKANP